MNRRDFFRLATPGPGPRRSDRWLRPPFALDESPFLLACTRCDKCIEACPHGVLFQLPSRYGDEAAGTPAMDLVNHGCHLCADWPCVAACEPAALKRPEEAGPGGDLDALPKLAVLAVDRESCLAYLGPECGACAHVCPVPGALTWEQRVRPVIDEMRCVGCGLCREACILEPKAIKVAVYQVREQTKEAS